MLGVALLSRVKVRLIAGLGIRPAVSLVLLGLLLASPLLAWGHLGPELASFAVDEGPQPDFHEPYSYAHPHAPKGGAITLPTLKAWGSQSPYQGKSASIDGLETTFVTLFEASNDPHDAPTACYAYAAQSIRFDDAQGYAVITLRPQATFHDGTPILSHDILTSFALFQHASPGGAALRKSSSLTMKALNDRQIRLDVPTPSLLRKAAYTLMTTMIILKASESGQSLHKLRAFTGAGPYRMMAAQTHGGSLTYGRVKGWWGEQLPKNKGRYNFDTITYVYFSSPDASFEALKKGSIDARLENKAANWIRGYTFKGISQGRVRKVTLPLSRQCGIFGTFFNLRRPALQDARVREALGLMFDAQWINANLMHNKAHIHTSFFEGTPYVGTRVGTAPQALELSLKQRQSLAFHLLKKAGWVFKQGKLYHKVTGEGMHLSILMPSQSAIRLFQDYTQRLKHLGIDAHLEVPDAAVMQKRLMAWDYDMLAYRFIAFPGLPESALWQQWHSSMAFDSQGANRSGVQNSEIDTILEDLHRPLTFQQKKSLLQKLDRTLWAGHYIIPQWTQLELNIAVRHTISRPRAQSQAQIMSPIDACIFGLHSWWRTPISAV